jgi:excisionase family DNA binding protein
VSAIPQLISVNEFAKQLGVSKCWVYRHARELNGVKVGKLWRFSESQNPRLQISKPAPYCPRPRREN